jgi:hypothetical protein
MSTLVLMQKLLDQTIEKLQDVEEKIKDVNTIGLNDLKKERYTLLRTKITLIQSIDELKPSNSTIAVYTPLKKSFFTRVKNFFGFEKN